MLAGRATEKRCAVDDEWEESIWPGHRVSSWQCCCIASCREIIKCQNAEDQMHVATAPAMARRLQSWQTRPTLNTKAFSTRQAFNPPTSINRNTACSMASLQWPMVNRAAQFSRIACMCMGVVARSLTQASWLEAARTARLRETGRCPHHYRC